MIVPTAPAHNSARSTLHGKLRPPVRSPRRAGESLEPPLNVGDDSSPIAIYSEDPQFMTHPAPPLDVPQRVLLGPGPSDVSPRVLAALGAPTIGHLDPHYLMIMDETRRMLRAVFRTANEMTMAVSGTG